MWTLGRPTAAVSILIFGALLLAAGSVVAARSSVLGFHHPDRGTTPFSNSFDSTAMPTPLSAAQAAAGAALTTPVPDADAEQPPVRQSLARRAPSSGPTVAASTTPSSESLTTSASITYTVKKGDTLSGIAEWFKQHGYRKLYGANRQVIGANPNLIRPGERITISNGKMTLANPT